LSFYVTGQETQEKKTDSIVFKKNYGLRVGLDLSKPIISARDANFSGFEMVADYRLKKNFYLATELGFIDKTSQEDNYNFTTTGSYINLGINVNSFNNWLEMDNELYYGARYGFSSFSHTLNKYTIFQNGSLTNSLSSAYFDPKTVSSGQKFSSLNAHWVALVLGMKVETFKNLYLGLSMNINKLLSSKEPTNFKNLYIPGFNKVYATKSSVSFNYTLSYRIPLYKK
jgi:hypothetical protein